MPSECSPDDAARRLLASVYGAWPTERAAGVLSTVSAEWDQIRTRPLMGDDGETCRQAMLAATTLGRYAEAARWRARAMSRFVATGWREGAMAIAMTDVFRILAMHNDGYARGSTIDVIEPSEDAMAVLDELEHFAVGAANDGRLGPDPPLIARFMFEKRGFLFVLDKRYDEAIASYDAALDHVTSDRRGELKVMAGRELARFLRDLADGGDGEPQASETAEIGRLARKEGIMDVADTADANAAIMRTGSRTLHPYEIL